MARHEKKEHKKKLKSKKAVVSQRTDRQKALQHQREAKSFLGAERRTETAQIHRSISEFKEKELEKKKIICDQIHELHKEQEVKRGRMEQYQKLRAEKNFNSRWLQEYEKRRKAERETSSRDRVIKRKIEQHSQLIQDVITQ